MNDIVVRGKDGEVVVPSSFRERWELFDNRLEWTSHTADTSSSLDVPFTVDELETWVEIDRITQLIKEGNYVEVSRFSIKHEVVCRFFDPQIPHYILTMELDDESMNETERMRVYNSILLAANDLETKQVCYDNGEWYKSLLTGPHFWLLGDSISYSHTVHLRDVFFRARAHTQHFLDRLLRDLHPRYDVVKVYDSYAEARKLISNISSKRDYFEALRLMKNLPNLIYDSYWNVLGFLGLMALAEDHFWSSTVDDPLCHWGGIILEPYVICGPDKDGRDRAVIKRGRMRALVDLFIDEGVAYFILRMCEIWIIYRNTPPRLSRFTSMLRDRLRFQR